MYARWRILVSSFWFCVLLLDSRRHGCNLSRLTRVVRERNRDNAITQNNDAACLQSDQPNALECVILFSKATKTVLTLQLVYSGGYGHSCS